MRLPSSKLAGKQRSAVRFLIVGNLGTLLQYALYSGLLQLFEYLWPDAPLVTVAFTLAYMIEVVVNYILTAYYTFSSKPTMKNAGGFAAGRAFNYVLQIVLLYGFAWFFMRTIPNDEMLANKLAGISSIVVAGIVNFFVMHFFFSKDKKLQTDETL